MRARLGWDETRTNKVVAFLSPFAQEERGCLAWAVSVWAIIRSIHGYMGCMSSVGAPVKASLLAFGGEGGSFSAVIIQNWIFLVLG